MNQLTIAAISCVITIIIKESAFLVLNIRNPNVVIDFIVFALIFVAIFSLVEKFGGRKEKGENDGENRK